MAATPKEGGASTPTTTADYGDVISGNTMIDILKPTHYYLDAPISEVRKNPTSVSLYDSTLTMIGRVASYNNGKLEYHPVNSNDVGDGIVALYSANASYSNLGEKKNTTFYFLHSTPTDDNDSETSSAVFIKQGGNYIYFGYVDRVDDINKVYAIKDISSGTLISTKIESTTKTFAILPNYIDFGDGDKMWFVSYEENAIYVKHFNDVYTIGYIDNASNDIASAVKDEDEGNLYYYNNDGEEVMFEHNENEEFDTYKTRYFIEVDADSQILGVKNSFCDIPLIGDIDKLMCRSFYSWQLGSEKILPYILSFYAKPSLNHFEADGTEIETTITTLSAYNSEGVNLCTFGEFGSDVAIDHFGNMLIVRDLERHTTHYYVFSDGAYKLYGNAGETELSFKVSIKEQIHSPKMTDVPMFYKAPFVSASDGSIDGRACLAAAEPIAPLKSFNSNSGLLISESDGYFRGEFAMFVVARAKDGTEVYRTTPQVLRSETLLGGDSQVFVFCPETEEDRRILDGERNEDDMKKASYIAEGTFPYYYLVWARQYLDHSFTAGEKGQAYNRYIAWRDRYKNRYANKIQPLLDSVTASDLYKLKVEIDSKGNNIHELAIYSTRLYPLFEIGTGYVKTNPIDCLNQPFYEMKVLSGDTKEYTITADDFTAIETKTDKVYTPTQSGENDFFATKSMEYNNCLHSFGIELFQPSINGKEYNGDESDAISDIALSRTYDGATYYARYGVEDFFKGDARNYKGLASAQPYLLAYADRISKVLFGKYSDALIAIDAVGSFAPEYSSSLNISYITNKEENTYDSSAAAFMRPNIVWDANNYTYSTFSKEINDKSRSSAKYRVINIANLDSPEQVPLSPTYPIKVGNRVQVSETNNPLSNPYNRSYRIGTINNEIIAINSAAIEMSDAKFGEFPLYAFTTEGIFAMQSGTETVYSNIVPSPYGTYDVVINPNTLAVNGAVLYFTDKGLHMLSQNGAQLISAGLHEDDNRIPEWMYTCRMVHLPEYNEVMCLLMDGDETTGKAYVFSLDNNYWSERDVPSGYTLNNNEVFGESSIHNLVNEGESVVKEITLETRPIKLGANKELKRLETLIVRFEADVDEKLEVTIKGSIDGVEYKDLRKVSATTNTDVLIRRTPASVKYLKFVVKSSNLQSSIRLIRFDTEHYLRFVRKMR